MSTAETTTLTNQQFYTIVDTLWRFNDAAILSIVPVYPKSLYVYVTEDALSKGINIPIDLTVKNVFVAAADNSIGYTKRGSSIITADLNEEIRKKLSVNTVNSKLIQISNQLYIYDLFTDLNGKQKVANIQFSV